MRGFWRGLWAAFLLSAGLLAGAPVAQAQIGQPGQQDACPLNNRAKIVSGTSYLLTTADRCQWVIFTNTGTVTITLPAPDPLFFRPGFTSKMVPTNGGTLSFVNAKDNAGVAHKLNLGSTLTLTAGTGLDLFILQDMNWWGAMLGGASAGTVQSVDLSMPTGFTVSNNPVTGSGTLTVTASSIGAHLFFAGPINGSAPWTLRAIDVTDLPPVACGGLTNAGTACLANTGTSGGTVGLLNGNNTYSGNSTFSGNITIGNVSLNASSTNVFSGKTSFGEVLFTVTTETGTSRTFSESDCGTEINFTNAAGATATIPNSLPVGCGISLRQGAAGAVTPAAGAGATLRSPHGFTTTSAQYAIIGINCAENSGGSAAVCDFVGDGQ